MLKKFLSLILLGVAGSCLNPAKADPAVKPIRLACVGDSITFGSRLADRNKDSYPAQLSRWLGTGWDVRNFGVSGATMLENSDLPYVHQDAYTSALDFAPDIVVIMLGTNDSKHRGGGIQTTNRVPENWAHKADYLPDYEKMIARFRQANPAVKIYACLPTPCFPGRWGIDDKTIHDEIIPLIRQVARDTSVSIIDLNTPLAGRSNLFPDTVHPNRAGDMIVAATIYQALTGKTAPAP